MTNTYRDLGIVQQDEEDFVDILEERRLSSDLGFAFRTFSPPPHKGPPPCTNAELHRAVLDSQYLRYVTKEVQPFFKDAALRCGDVNNRS
ncbi:dihydroxyacetone phosphate acyltransferase [Austrofundulus limnaeus]|uniref:Dihydroxyacetone phosphate acyltransferase n=1 Tax=Austrofundulus limnaeus TaxID=52670 RepID=A0A2I4BHX2_AUSLI|nr:PREDICTED: dihydroxyacetone phosphate acyltransferase-like [Austrofundulus limnaeus]